MLQTVLLAVTASRIPYEFTKVAFKNATESIHRVIATNAPVNGTVRIEVEPHVCSSHSSSKMTIFISGANGAKIGIGTYVLTGVVPKGSEYVPMIRVIGNSELKADGCKTDS